jgi:hypothetical protein
MKDQLRAIAPAWEVLDWCSHQDALSSSLIVEARLRTSVSIQFMRSTRHPSELVRHLEIGELPNKVIRPFPYRPGRRRVRFK